MGCRPLLLLLLGCASPVHAAFMDCLFFDGLDGEGAATPAPWKGNLREHNCARKTVVPAAHPALPLLHWNTTIAQTAQIYSNQCLWQHSGAPGLGENLYASTSSTGAQTASADNWASEFQYFNYSANSCASGQTCGHYTQMVWRATSQLGCGVSNCTTGSPFGSGNWTLVVCNYSPPGNIIGQRPY